MRQRFDTTSGLVEVAFDEQTRIVSAHRFGANGHVAAAAIESWDHVDFVDVLTRQLGVPRNEAEVIASKIRSVAVTSGLQTRVLEAQGREGELPAVVDSAGLSLRFVAVLLDAVIVLFPLAIIFGLLFGGGYSESAAGSMSAGVNVSGEAFWLALLLGLGYYVACESATGMTLGKRMVGIRVVDENGRHPTLSAAVVRNLLRVIDALFFYLVGGVVALASSRRQRLGDRAAHTVVVRR
jgi:uncharacterized RDD family membrane protein YckC